METNLILLESVGCLFDEDALWIYPSPAKGFPIDYDNKIDFLDYWENEEWRNKLNLEDKIIIAEILFKRLAKLRQIKKSL